MSGFFTVGKLKLRTHPLWRKVEIGAPSQCWEWQGARLPKGYGRIKIKGRAVLAHRVAYDLAYGPLSASDDALMVLHSCDNPPCCNPHHLRLGTAADNVQDMFKRNRKSRIPPWHPNYRKPDQAA